MRFQWLHRRVREITTRALAQMDDPEIDRMMVGDALVVRDGDHFAIESGGESWESLEAEARRLGGECDCGRPLSARADALVCRACGRRFSRH